MLATAGLCLPLGTAVTAGVCAASLHFQDPAAKDAGILRQAVLLQGQGGWVWAACLCTAALSKYKSLN